MWFQLEMISNFIDLLTGWKTRYFRDKDQRIIEFYGKRIFKHHYRIDFWDCSDYIKIHLFETRSKQYVLVINRVIINVFNSQQDLIDYLPNLGLNTREKLSRLLNTKYIFQLES